LIKDLTVLAEFGGWFLVSGRGVVRSAYAFDEPNEGESVFGGVVHFDFGFTGGCGSEFESREVSFAGVEDGFTGAIASGSAEAEDVGVSVSAVDGLVDDAIDIECEKSSVVVGIVLVINAKSDLEWLTGLASVVVVPVEFMIEFESAEGVGGVITESESDDEFGELVGDVTFA
jgi:hypothetical protein